MSNPPNLSLVSSTQTQHSGGTAPSDDDLRPIITELIRVAGAKLMTVDMVLTEKKYQHIKLAARQAWIKTQSEKRQQELKQEEQQRQQRAQELRVEEALVSAAAREAAGLKPLTLEEVKQLGKNAEAHAAAESSHSSQSTPPPARNQQMDRLRQELAKLVPFPEVFADPEFAQAVFNWLKHDCIKPLRRFLDNNGNDLEDQWYDELSQVKNTIQEKMAALKQVMQAHGHLAESKVWEDSRILLVSQKTRDRVSQILRNHSEFKYLEGREKESQKDRQARLAKQSEFAQVEIARQQAFDARKAKFMARLIETGMSKDGAHALSKTMAKRYVAETDADLVNVFKTEATERFKSSSEEQQQTGLICAKAAGMSDDSIVQLKASIQKQSQPPKPNPIPHKKPPADRSAAGFGEMKPQPKAEKKQKGGKKSKQK